MNKNTLKDMRILHKQLIDVSTQICNLSDCLDASQEKEKMGRSLMYETLSSIHSLCGWLSEYTLADKESELPIP